MAVRVSWPQIKAHIDNDTNGWLYDEPVIVVIPEGGRRILFGLENLNWEATYRIDGYDYADWDELQAIIHATYNGLMGATPMIPLIEKLEEIRAETEGIKDAIGNIAIPDSSASIDALAALIDPRLAVLIQLVDSIDDVMGGVYEPPPEPLEGA